MLRKKKIKIIIKDRTFMSSRAAKEYAILRYKQAANETKYIFKIKVFYWYNSQRKSEMIELGHGTILGNDITDR